MAQSVLRAHNVVGRPPTSSKPPDPAARGDEKPYDPEGAAAAEPAAEPAAAEPAEAEKKTWTADEIGKMTVAKLKEALTTLGLDTSGLKAALKDRLTDAMGL